MCLICVCCNSAKFCTFAFAIFTAVESLVFATLNLILIFGYTCTLQPTPEEDLAPGFKFLEKVWSWFFYDEDNCIEKYGSDYEAPEWVSGIPAYIRLSGAFDVVTAQKNYAYQISYVILHCFWFVSALILLYGNGRKYPSHFIPWITIASALVVMDTVFGSFYIRLMDETTPSWDDGEAMFTMQFLYFRGFLIYILNVSALITVFYTFWKVNKKRRKEEKMNRKIQTTTEVMVQSTLMPSTSQAEPVYSSNPNFSQHPPLYQQQQNLSHGIYSEDEAIFQKQPAPTKYRPFSYTNPEFRPSDPHDVEGMRHHAPKTQTGATPPPHYQAQMQLEAMKGIDEAPKHEEVHSRYDLYK